MNNVICFPRTISTVVDSPNSLRRATRGWDITQEVRALGVPSPTVRLKPLQQAQYRMMLLQ